MTSSKKRRTRLPPRRSRRFRLPFSSKAAAAVLVGGLIAVWMIANFRADRIDQSIQDSDRDLIERMAAKGAPTKGAADNGATDNGATATGAAAMGGAFKDTPAQQGAAVGTASTNATVPVTADDLVEARNHSVFRILHEPLDTWPLSLIAFLADARGDSAETARVRSVLIERTKRDTPTLVWSINQALAAGHVETALKGLDLVSRMNAPQEIRDEVYAALVSLAADPSSRRILVDQLRLMPSWRQTFLNGLASTGAIGAFPDLMQTLQDEQLPSANPAWRVYLQRLINAGDAPQAYALWVGLQPVERLALLRNIFDGTFSTPPDGTMFDWNLAGNSGIAASFAAGEGQGGRAALRLEFSGTHVPQGIANQAIVLAPGRYRLSGHLRYESLQTERGLGWQVFCLDGNKQTLIGDTDRFSGDHNWTPFLADFEVPAALCSVQLLQLSLPARIAVEQVVRGRIWADDLAIERVDLDRAAPSN